MTNRGPDRPAEGRARPLNPLRDLEAVVDLIGVAFGERLDPAAQATLSRMRRFAHRGPLLQWLLALTGTVAAAPGLVWEKDGRVVGNVSVRRARASDGYLIGNVVVHPDHRRQGIATTLMRKAIQTIKRRGGRWVGLEVRAGNQVAVRLYERFRFHEVGRTHHLLRAAGLPSPILGSRSELLRRARPGDGLSLVKLMKVMIPEEQRPLLEVQETDYRPGWGRRIDHWLRCEDEVWWVAEADDGIEGAVRAVSKRGAFPHRIELLARPGVDVPTQVALVRQGLTGLRGQPSRPVETSLPDGAQSLELALKEAGFRQLRVLIQMRRCLRRQIRLRKG